MKHNILLITPMYQIIGREELERDSICIYDLTKYWTSSNNLLVINNFPMGIRKITRFLKKENRIYYENGYHYHCGDIPVFLIERQNFFPKQKQGHYLARKRFNHMIEQELKKEHFIPNVILVHLPCISSFFINKLNYKCNKVAILHYSDVLFLNKKGDKYIQHLKETYQYIFCRSKAIYDIFKKYHLPNLQKELILSGVPKVDITKDICNNKFKKSKIQILYVGKLIKRKNLDILIRALKLVKNKNWELIVIGSGPMLEKYQNLVNELNLAKMVKFLGNLPKSKVFEFMSKADIFCMPSVRETLGLVYLEAMSHGCITIGIQNEGIDGIIKNNKNGFLIHPNEKELTEVITKIIDMKTEERNHIIQEAIKTGNYYNEEDMSQRYLNLVIEVIKNG